MVINFDANRKATIPTVIAPNTVERSLYGLLLSRIGASQEALVRFFVANRRNLEFILCAGSGFRDSLRASFIVHVLVTQSVTSDCNGAFVQRHVWLVGAHGEFWIAVPRQVNWRD